MTVLLEGLARGRVDDLVHLFPIDCERKSAPEPQVTKELAPFTVIDVEVGIERDL